MNEVWLERIAGKGGAVTLAEMADLIAIKSYSAIRVRMNRMVRDGWLSKDTIDGAKGGQHRFTITARGLAVLERRAADFETTGQWWLRAARLVRDNIRSVTLIGDNP